MERSRTKAGKRWAAIRDLPDAPYYVVLCLDKRIWISGMHAWRLDLLEEICCCRFQLLELDAGSQLT